MYRALRAFSWALLPLAVYGCGSTDDPKVSDVTDLQPISTIEVIPGDENVTLKWYGSNNEDDFSGYSIYKMQTGTLAALNQELGDRGLNPIDGNDPHLLNAMVIDDTTRNIISKYFNNAAAEEDCAVEAADAAEATTLCPIARCNATTAGQSDSIRACAPITEASADHEENPVNGWMEFKVEGLTNATEYTFFVVPTMKSGKRIATLTSNVVKARPRAVLEISGIPAGALIKQWAASGTGYTGVDLNQDVTGSELAAVSTVNKGTGATSDCMVSESGVAFFFESPNNSPVSPGIVPANGTRIKYLGSLVDDAGTFESDFLASLNRLGGKALLTKLPDGTADSDGSDTDDVGSAGYNKCGKTRALLPQQLYSIAYKGEGDKLLYAMLYTGAEGSGGDAEAGNFRIVLGATENDLRL